VCSCSLTVDCTINELTIRSTSDYLSTVNDSVMCDAEVVMWICFQEVVNVDFEYFDPKPDDFHGVKALLRTYLDDEVWDVSAFTDLVLAQTTVGTVVEAGAVKDVEVEIPPMRVAGIATW
jgi:hypothetical protein